MIYEPITWATALIVFLGLLTRYALISGGATLLLYKTNLKNKLAHLYVNKSVPGKKQIHHEIKYSLVSTLIFVGSSLIIVYGVQNGSVELYHNISDRGLAYYLGSIFAVFAIQDIYFYLIHRLLHTPWLYRHVHSVHHFSKNPTSLATFSAHPVEAIMQLGIVYFVYFLFPIHTSLLAIYPIGVTLINSAVHSGYEIYPKVFSTGFWAKWIVTPTFHIHHHQSNTHKNFGFITQIWDNLWKTQKN